MTTDIYVNKQKGRLLTRIFPANTFAYKFHIFWKYIKIHIKVQSNYSKNDEQTKAFIAGNGKQAREFPAVRQKVQVSFINDLPFFPYFIIQLYLFQVC